MSKGPSDLINIKSTIPGFDQHNQSNVSKEEARDYLRQIEAKVKKPVAGHGNNKERARIALKYSREMPADLWRFLTKTEPPEDARKFPERLGRQGVKSGSIVWFVASMLEANDGAREALRRDDWTEFFFSTLQLGLDLATVRGLIKNRKELGTGIKQRIALTRARDQSALSKRMEANKRHKLWVAEAKMIWQTNPSLSPSRCADRVIEKLGLDVDNRTVRDVIKTVWPKKKVGNA